MSSELEQNILKKVRNFDGKISISYKNLITGETIDFNEKVSHTAASIIKIPIMIEAFSQISKGILSPNKLFEIKNYRRVPPAGILTFMNEGLTPSTLDLIYLMIVISDNMATNILIEELGIDNINETMKSLGTFDTVLERQLFDPTPRTNDRTNRITTADMSLLLEMIYNERLIDAQSSKKMIDILKGQQLNDKIPMFLPLDYTVAHKTGDIDNIAHDVGIVYAKEPFIVCFCGSDVNVASFNRLIGEITFDLFNHCGGIDENMLAN